MQDTFELDAVSRADQGKGASRRLRRTGMVPGIIYGGGKDPEAVAVEHNEFAHHLENEAFYSHILTVKVGGKGQKVVLKDLQRHPSKPFIQHFDLLRVSDKEAIKMHVPLHFVGEETAPGVKVGGGQFLHNMTDVEVVCLPSNLPEFIELDVSAMDVGDLLHLSDIKIPEGVELTAMHAGEEHDLPVIQLVAKKHGGEEEDEEAAEGGAVAAEGEPED